VPRKRVGAGWLFTRGFRKKMQVVAPILPASREIGWATVDLIVDQQLKLNHFGLSRYNRKTWGPILALKVNVPRLISLGFFSRQSPKPAIKSHLMWTPPNPLAIFADGRFKLVVNSSSVHTSRAIDPLNIGERICLGLGDFERLTSRVSANAASP